MWGGFGFSPSAMIILSGLKGSFQPPVLPSNLEFVAGTSIFLLRVSS